MTSVQHRSCANMEQFYSAAGNKRSFEEGACDQQQRLKIACMMAYPLQGPPQQSSSPCSTEPCSFEFWPSHRPRLAFHVSETFASPSSHGHQAAGDPTLASSAPPSLQLAHVRRVSEFSFGLSLDTCNNTAARYREASNCDLDLQAIESPVTQSPKWSPVRLVPLAQPVLPQPAPDPESNVFKPEPMLHLNGEPIQHLSLLGQMQTKVAHTLRRRTARRVLDGALSQTAADVLLETCMGRLAKPVSMAFQRYCGAKRFFAEGQPCLSRLTLIDGRGALGLFNKDVLVVTRTLANSVLKAAVRVEAELRVKAALLLAEEEAGRAAEAKNDAHDVHAMQGFSMSFAGFSAAQPLGHSGTDSAQVGAESEPANVWPAGFLSLDAALPPPVTRPDAPESVREIDPDVISLSPTSPFIDACSAQLLSSCADSPVSSEGSDESEDGPMSEVLREAVHQLQLPSAQNGPASSTQVLPESSGGPFLTDQLDVALAGAFMAGLDSIDWFEAVQEVYGIEPEELLEQQESLQLGDDEYAYGAAELQEQVVGHKEAEEEEVPPPMRRPSIWR